MVIVIACKLSFNYNARGLISLGKRQSSMQTHRSYVQSYQTQITLDTQCYLHFLSS